MDRGKGRERKRNKIKKRIDYLRECGPLYTHTCQVANRTGNCLILQLKANNVKSDLTKILLQCDIVWLKSDYKIQTRLFILFK